MNRLIKSRYVVFLTVLFTLISCSNIMNSEEVEEIVDKKEGETMEYVQIKLSFKDKEIIVKMFDSPSTTDFLKLLPIVLEFEDYNSTEKITYLPRKLSNDNVSTGMTPQVGDFAYYAPWGNLAIFYKGFSYSSGLVLLGQIEEGIENLELIENKEIVKIEVISD